MKEKVAAILMGASRKLKNWSERIFVNDGIDSFEHARWLSDRGDKLLRLTYSLDENSVVLDLGGYEGQWASDIYSKYNCTVLVFEPVFEFYKFIVDRFSKNGKIKAFHYGISDSDSHAYISINDDQSSTKKNTNNSEDIVLHDIAYVIQEQKLDTIDLLKINIEGGEYEVINRLIETGDIRKITNLQVQFHNFSKDCADRMLKIQEKLSVTHEPTYQYRFVWENWTRKSDEEDAQ